jgi:threonine synthase
VADRYGWGFVNINLRSYYAEGAKTMGFEIVEQLGWRYPRHLVSPVAGGTLLPRIVRGLRELRTIGLVSGELPRVYAAQAAGCAPVVRAIEAGLEYPEPVRPDTIAKSIAIGNPADGYQVIQSIRATGGTGAAVSDSQIVDAIRLLAETEGIFTEPAGGTTLAAAIDLINRGTIPRDESIVVCVTGNGYKTTEAVTGTLTAPVRLSRSFKDFEAWWESARGPAKAAVQV